MSLCLDPRGLPDNTLEEVLLAGVRALRKVSPSTCRESLPRYACTAEYRSNALKSLLSCARELDARSEAKRLVGQCVMGSPQVCKDYLIQHCKGLDFEVFMLVFLDAQLRIITVEEMFRGTLTQTSIYPREVVKRCLMHAAGAVILAHNHPSGSLEPSRADELLTQTLKQALQLVDVKVLDHFIVGRDQCTSFAERGLI